MEVLIAIWIMESLSPGILYIWTCIMIIMRKIYTGEEIFSNSNLKKGLDLGKNVYFIFRILILILLCKSFEICYTLFDSYKEILLKPKIISIFHFVKFVEKVFNYYIILSSVVSFMSHSLLRRNYC